MDPRANENAHSEAKSLEDAGNSALQNGDYQKALNFFSKARDKYRKIGYREKEADQWNKMANCLLNTNKPNEALKALEATIQLLKQKENRARRARAFSNMGFLNTQLKRFDDALSCFQNAHDIFEVLGDDYGRALQLGNIGSVYRDKADPKRALDFYFDAISIFEEIGHKLGQADQFTNIGYAYALDQKPDDALEWFSKALPLYEEFQRKDLAEQTRQNIINLSESGP